ncbi:MAG: rhodanese-like domain-containing protein [Sulfurovum sp.]|nr:rhodanese-like domain-containing protein [Sulfurovum sp.]
MSKDKNTMNLPYWIAMIAIFLWFAYSKGWILANFASIDAKIAIQLIENDNNITLLDVRTIEEFKEGHLHDAVLIPLQALSENLGMLKQDKNKKILVYCRTGNRSISASRILQNAGFTPINIQGGILSLIAEKVEMVK